MIIEDGSAIIEAAPFDPVQLKKLGRDISRLVLDSRTVQPGDTFVAYQGERHDGRHFIRAAVAAGAQSVLWDSLGWHWDATLLVPNLGIPSLRRHLGAIASHVLSHPSAKLWVIGVTGTNGKTSCSQWIASALNRLDKKCAVIGTLGAGFPGELVETRNTTPDALSLHTAMAQFVEAGSRTVTLEVSSHALIQDRVNAIEFDIAVLTNLTQDHLDYHGDMAGYRSAKAKLFDCPGLKFAVLNLDDSFGLELLRRLPRPGLNVLGYGFNAGSCAFLGRDLRQDEAGLTFEVATPWGVAEINSVLLGRFNACNLLAALAALTLSDIKLADAVSALHEVEPVPGRLQRIGGGGLPVVVIDYAHTPDALKNVLSTLRELAQGALICVFGCGGNRDRAKRPLMGEVASSLADRVFLTSDNPRSEDPLAIISEIAAGTTGQPEVIAERRAAIERAIAEAQKDDIVLIAGKGHEAYQEVAGVKLPFDDVKVAQAALALRKRTP
ncbi:MAG TPA: UDP-N-acetylmuramoyl-L-alanyl-D-glutamate--2,6-diaminopimelate ligase [Burkholderiales bacterium]|nr:UDP-N-acetylmuramoyl-L-alanyl-D-glutamate--2,6-diaminopimelate ligase [Burkholderiales bacterium]